MLDGNTLLKCSAKISDKKIVRLHWNDVKL